MDRPEAVLAQAPARIAAASMDLFEHKRRVDGARHQLRMLEADVAEAVAKAMGPDGKPAHRNETERTAAVRRSLEATPRAMELRRALHEEEAVVARVEATLQFLRDQQANSRALVLGRTPWDTVFEALPEEARR